MPLIKGDILQWMVSWEPGRVIKVSFTATEAGFIGAPNYPDGSTPPFDPATSQQTALTLEIMEYITQITGRVFSVVAPNHADIAVMSDVSITPGEYVGIEFDTADGHIEHAYILNRINASFTGEPSSKSFGKVMGIGPEQPPGSCLVTESALCDGLHELNNNGELVAEVGYVDSEAYFELYGSNPNPDVHPHLNVTGSLGFKNPLYGITELEHQGHENGTFILTSGADKISFVGDGTRFQIAPRTDGNPGIHTVITALDPSVTTTIYNDNTITEQATIRGNAIIHDFSTSGHTDILNLEYTDLTNWVEVQSAMQQVGDDVHIDNGNGTTTILVDKLVTDITEDNIAFAPVTPPPPPTTGPATSGPGGTTTREPGSGSDSTGSSNISDNDEPSQSNAWRDLGTFIAVASVALFVCAGGRKIIEKFQGTGNQDPNTPKPTRKERSEAALAEALARGSNTTATGGTGGDVELGDMQPQLPDEPGNGTDNKKGAVLLGVSALLGLGLLTAAKNKYTAETLATDEAVHSPAGRVLESVEFDSEEIMVSSAGSRLQPPMAVLPAKIAVDLATVSVGKIQDWAVSTADAFSTHINKITEAATASAKSSAIHAFITAVSEKIATDIGMDEQNAKQTSKVAGIATSLANASSLTMFAVSSIVGVLTQRAIEHSKLSPETAQKAGTAANFATLSGLNIALFMINPVLGATSTALSMGTSATVRHAVKKTVDEVYEPARDASLSTLEWLGRTAAHGVGTVIGKDLSGDISNTRLAELNEKAAEDTTLSEKQRALYTKQAEELRKTPEPETTLDPLADMFTLAEVSAKSVTGTVTDGLESVGKSAMGWVGYLTGREHVNTTSQEAAPVKIS